MESLSSISVAAPDRLLLLGAYIHLSSEQNSNNAIGDGSIISLHETKPIGRGEGGAVFVSSDMAPFVHKALNFGYDIPNGTNSSLCIARSFGNF